VDLHAPNGHDPVDRSSGDADEALRRLAAKVRRADDRVALDTPVGRLVVRLRVRPHGVLASLRGEKTGVTGLVVALFAAPIALSTGNAAFSTCCPAKYLHISFFTADFASKTSW
jgi:hypothetical protein